MVREFSVSSGQVIAVTVGAGGTGGIGSPNPLGAGQNGKNGSPGFVLVEW
jgi:hypothetical protein